MGDVSMWEVKEEEMTKKLREQDIWLYNQQVELKPAFERVIKELREDEDYYRSWRDNIAMSFYDESRTFKKEFGRKFMNNNSIREIANAAADNFLKLLIK